MYRVLNPNVSFGEGRLVEARLCELANWCYRPKVAGRRYV